MELGSYFLFLQEQIKDIIIISDGGKTGGNNQSRIFEHPEDAERLR